jgi:hypothetical protein
MLILFVINLVKLKEAYITDWYGDYRVTSRQGW